MIGFARTAQNGFPQKAAVNAKVAAVLRSVKPGPRGSIVFDKLFAVLFGGRLNQFSKPSFGLSGGEGLI
jgi:hypothetical protein